MTDYALAEAFVQIRPDTTGFRAEAESKLKAALSGLNLEAKIKLTPDISGFSAALKAAIAKALGGAKAADIKIPVRVIADEGSVNEALRLIKQRMAQVGVVDFLDYNLPIGKMQFQIQLLKRLFAQADLADFLAVNLKPGQTLSAAEALKTAVQRELSGVSIAVGLSDADIAAAAAAARAAVVAALGGKITIPVTETVTPTAVPLPQEVSGVAPGGGSAAVQAAAAAAAAALARLAGQETNAANAAKLAYAANTLNNVALGDTKVKADNAGGGIGILNGLVVAGGNGWGALTGKIKLFGGALGSIPIIGIASYWHILTDLIIEVGTELLGATIGILAFGAVAAPTAQHIAVQFQNIWTASNALNQAIYPLTKNFKNLDAAVKPEVYTLLGEGLVVATAKAGEFAKVAAAVGKVLDQLGARAAAALISGGFGQFLQKAPVDVAQIGTLIGNIFGIIGNFLKVLPGYAQVLFGVLDKVTGALENISASPVTEFVLKWGLAFHGAVLYIGLAVTAVAILGNALTALAVKLGLASASAQFFNTTLFLSGVRQAVGGIGLLATELFTLDGAENIAAAGALTLEGAFAALQALAPVLIVTAIAAAAYGLYKIFTAGSAVANAYAKSITDALATSPISQLGINLVRQQASAIGSLADAQLNLAHTQEYTTTVNVHTGEQIRQLTPQYIAQSQQVKNQQAALAALAPIQKNYNQLLSDAHGNTALLVLAGITSNDVIGASAAKMAQLNVEVQAQVDQLKAMALGTGRAAAAMNALNYTGDTTNNTLGSLDVDMQKIITGQDDLTNVIIGGEQAFIGFDQGIRQWGTDLGKGTGFLNALTGTTAKSLTTQSDFYNTVVPGAQKLTDALELQLAPTNQITAAVATEAKYMLALAGNNQTMQAVIISLINNALGPGTVSFQNLNKWVTTNSTTQQGFQAIVAQSTVNAGKLGGTIGQLTQTMFENDLMMSAHVTPDLKAYTNAIVNNGVNSDAAQGARARLIRDYENAGLSAQQATTLVNGLTKGIDNVPSGKTITLGIAGHGQIAINATGAYIQGESGHIVASGFAGGTSGAPPGWAWVGEKGPELVKFKGGEVVVPAGAAGYAGGTPGAMLLAEGEIAGMMTAAFEQAAGKAFVSGSEHSMGAAWYKKYLQTAAFHQSGGGGGGIVPGIGGGVRAYAGLAAQVLAMLGQPARDLSVVLAQMTTESGGNPFAVNLSDINAQEGHPSVGLMQVIAGTYAGYGAPKYGYPLPVAYGVSENPLANIYAGMAYAVSRYGSDYAYGPPTGWTQVLGHGHGYAGGTNHAAPGWGWVGERGPEMVLPAASTRKMVPVASPTHKITIQMASSGNAGFDQFMTSWMSKATLVKGGGSVQVAFGTSTGAYS